MEVLHLTDLHVTEPNTSLEAVWTTAVDKLRAVHREQFDFIVVSGNLTQRAGDGEYRRLKDFTDHELLPLLRKEKELHRIVFVPGNHDVDWAQKLGTPLRRPTRKQIAEFKKAPHTAALRGRINDAGQAEFVHRRPAQYAGRFTNVQRFLAEFYPGGAAPWHRPFNLISQKPSDHWSAHIFPNDGVAFFGFNSCFYNDAYWRGATLEEEAVTAAASYARQHARGLLWVAVWHHGLSSERGQPDHLLTRDLGFLRFNGFTIGVHGHTHVDEFVDLRDVLGERFPIVATGSFAAGPAERPEGTLNQFAVLEMGPSYLCIERFERRPTTEWKRQKLAPYVLQRGEHQSETFNEADRHARLFHFFPETGTSRITIELTDAEVRQELIFAEPQGPYSNVVFDDHALADGEQVAVYDSKGPDGKLRLTFAGRRHYDNVGWSCLLSNVLARDRGDLVMREPSRFGALLKKSGWDERDWIAHTVRLHSRTLTLGIEVKAGSPSPAPDPLFDAAEVGLRAFDQNDVEDYAEGRRGKVKVEAGGLQVSATIERPFVGYRYVLGYRPQVAGNVCPADTLALISNVADRLRAGLPNDTGWQALTEGVERGLRSALRCSDPEQSVIWYGYLWHHGKRRLQTCFGNCPWSAAGIEFEYGRGVVGHAFRTCRPASYFATERSTSLLLTGETPFDWIVAVPLLLDEKGPAVGAIGFAGRHDRGWDRDLRDYAQRGGRGLNELELRLLGGTTLPFWSELRHVVKDSSETDQREFTRIYEAWRARVKAPRAG